MSAEVDGLLHYMPILVRDDGVTDWERKFCASMIARSRSRAFTPSDKQTATMRRIVTKFQASKMGHDDLIER